MKISLIFFSLMSGLSVALLALMPAIPQKKIGKSFFVSICLLSCLLIFPFFLALLPGHAFSTGLPLRVISLFIGFGLLSSILLILFYYKKKERVSSIIYGATIALGVVALFYETVMYLNRSPKIWWAQILIQLNFFSSAFLLGAALFAMLLGHWYLVQFDLDKSLLRRVCAIYCIALALRVTLVGINLWVFSHSTVLDPQVFTSLISLSGHGIFFWMRLTMGIFLPLILAYMIYETARIGANQSCTGLLYIAVLFVFMGEMVSQYVYFLKGIPL